MYDVIIIGAGAAGLTAAIYTARKALKTLIISIDIGGQTNLTSWIENYPGVDPMHGALLMKKFEDQAKGFGSQLIFGKVAKIDKINDKHFSVKLFTGENFETKTIILAFGKVPKSLGVKGENNFYGKGVSACVTCDGPLFKNKVVSIIGGGNSAVEGALELAKISKKVFLIHRRDKFTADEINIKRLNVSKNIELVLNSVVIEFKGKKKLSEIIIENVNTKVKKELKIDGVFIEIGFLIDPSMIKDFVKLNEKNEIIIDDRCNTSCLGVFAAGDATSVVFKQTIISAGEGAKAGLEAYRYLTGGSGVSLDWTTSKKEAKKK